MLRYFALLAIAVVLAYQTQGCTSGVDGLAEVGATDTQPKPVAKARDVDLQTDAYSFSYAYPAKAAAIPEVEAFLEQDLANSKAELVRTTAEAQADARKFDYPYRSHYLAVAWGVAADLPGWLSMSASVETYSGGAHGNQGFDVLLWDRKAREMRAPTDLFVSEEALRAAIQPAFCDALDAERMEKRGEESLTRDPSDSFNACIDPLESAILFESGQGDAFDTITVLVAPYMAGPYAEGSYVVSLPASDAVLAAAKPVFRKAFSVRR